MREAPTGRGARQAIGGSEHAVKMVGLAGHLGVGRNRVLDSRNIWTSEVDDHVERQMLCLEIGRPFRHRRPDRVGSGQLLAAAIPYAVRGERAREGVVIALIQGAKAAHHEVPTTCLGFNVRHDLALLSKLFAGRMLPGGRPRSG